MKIMKLNDMCVVSLFLVAVTPLALCQEIFNDDTDITEGSTPFSGDDNHDIMRFSKRMYSVLGTDDAANLAVKFKSEYKMLNADGTLGSVLGALYDMRMDDLLVSVERVRKMRELLETLDD
jgi:hypothetical protein